MKDKLPQNINKVECGIINLNDYYQNRSHWTAYYKNNDKKYYFDSYGDAPPPKELVRYLGSKILVYNKKRIQNYDDPPICGHLCLAVLEKLSKGKSYTDILNREIEGLKGMISNK